MQIGSIIRTLTLLDYFACAFVVVFFFTVTVFNMGLPRADWQLPQHVFNVIGMVVYLVFFFLCVRNCYRNGFFKTKPKWLFWLIITGPGFCLWYYFFYYLRRKNLGTGHVS